MRISIVVPVLNEAEGIAHTLDTLAPLRQRGHEIVVVDGGSTDLTVSVALGKADLVLVGNKGRAKQMNLGAAHSNGDVLLFLHADTHLPANADALIEQALVDSVWGRFDVRIDGESRMLPLVAALMNARSRLTGVVTGDQAIFIQRGVFQAINGFSELPLMEDIELSNRLRRMFRPSCIAARATTSGRRWDRRGAWKTIFLMWRLRWRYWRGQNAEDLARAYL